MKIFSHEPFKFRSKTIIGHVRLASCGNQTHLNTHPFAKKNWVFAHNGTVIAIKSLPEFRLQINPEGETDSEHAFLYLLQKMEGFRNEVINIIELESRIIKQHGNFNFLSYLMGSIYMLMAIIVCSLQKERLL